MSDQSFLKFSAIDNESLSEISKKIKKLQEVRLVIEKIEGELKRYKNEEEKISGEEIPELLRAHGLKSLKLETGESLEITESLYASLPKRDNMKRLEVLAWLRKNGGTDIIKQKISVDEQNIDRLERAGIPFFSDEDVHPQTLKSFISEVIGMKKGFLPMIELDEIPASLNVYIAKKTKIK